MHCQRHSMDTRDLQLSSHRMQAAVLESDLPRVFQGWSALFLLWAILEFSQVSQMHNVGDREINNLTWKEVLRKTVLLKNGFMSFDLMSDIISRLRDPWLGGFLFPIGKVHPVLFLGTRVGIPASQPECWEWDSNPRHLNGKWGHLPLSHHGFLTIFSLNLVFMQFMTI